MHVHETHYVAKITRTSFIVTSSHHTDFRRKFINNVSMSTTSSSPPQPKLLIGQFHRLDNQKRMCAWKTNDFRPLFPGLQRFAQPRGGRRDYRGRRGSGGVATTRKLFQPLFDTPRYRHTLRLGLGVLDILVGCPENGTIGIHGYRVTTAVRLVYLRTRPGNTSELEK